MKRYIAMMLALVMSQGIVSNVCFANDDLTQISWESQSSLSSIYEPFDDEIGDHGQGITKQYNESSYYKTEAIIPGSKASVEEVGDDKFLRLYKEENSGNAESAFELGVASSANSEVSYRIRFNEPYSTSYMPLTLSGSGGTISSTYISAMKFGLNFSGNDAAVQEWGQTTEISSNINLGEWYTLQYKINCDTQEYSLNIINEDGENIVELKSIPFRAKTNDFNKFRTHSPTDANRASSIDIDDFSVRTWPKDSVYYSITGPKELKYGPNEINVNLTNLTGKENNIGVYLKMYRDGQLVRYEKIPYEMKSGETVSETVNIDTSSYYKPEANNYISDALVIDNDGVSYKVLSESELSGTDSIDMKVTPNYAQKGLNLLCDTGYDNSTIMVLAPGYSLEEAL